MHSRIVPGLFLLICSFGLINGASWQQPFAEALMSPDHISRLAIIGSDGAVTGATPSGFNLLSGEGAKVLAAFDNPKGALLTGLTIGGVNFPVSKADSFVIYGKKGDEAVYAAKTISMAVVGVYTEGTQSQVPKNLIDKLAGYFIETGN